MVALGTRLAVPGRLEKQAGIYSSPPLHGQYRWDVFKGMIPEFKPVGDRWDKTHCFEQSIHSNPLFFQHSLDLGSKRLVYKMHDGSWTPDYFTQFVEGYVALLADETRVCELDEKMRQDFLGFYILSLNISNPWAGDSNFLAIFYNRRSRGQSI